jgi:hypothetical protein
VPSAAGEVRAVDAILEPGFVEQIEGPANRLTVRHEQIEVIQTEFLFAIEGSSHKAVNGERRDSGTALFTSRAEDELCRRVVIRGINQDTEDISFVWVAHFGLQRSLLNS